MGRKKLSALFMKYGVTVGCIAGSTSFINQDGKSVGVGVCCWFVGNISNNTPGEIRFGMFGCDGETVISDDVESDDDEDEFEDFGLTKLFQSAD